MTLGAEPSTDVVCTKQGHAGLIHLNRPKALNALTHNMVNVIAPALELWAHDPEITRILIDAEGEKAFCAGGDIRKVTEQGKSGQKAEAVGFCWRSRGGKQQERERAREKVEEVGNEKKRE